MEPLRATYAESGICHDRWRSVYRESRLEQRLDDRLYGWLFRKLRPHGLWLDAGCGSGERSLILANYAENVLGVDIAPAMLSLAEDKARSAGMSQRVRFERHVLEELPAGLECDHVHCRGVLMHIPDWRRALSNICRCLRRNGYLVIIEANCKSLEAFAVRSLRSIQRRKSRMVVTDGGLEFWAEIDGKPFVVRMAAADAIEREMRANNIEPLFRQPLAGFDLNRFPRAMRPLVTGLNRFWFELSLPLGSAVMIVGRKA